MNGLDNESGSCKICGLQLHLHEAQGPLHQLIKCTCPRCGQYLITDFGEFSIPNDMPVASVAALSHAVKVLGRGRAMGEFAVVSEALVREILKDPVLPKFPLQMENLILWLGHKQPDNGSPIELDEHQGQAIVGARSAEEFIFVMIESQKKGLVYSQQIGMPLSWELQLTTDGWARFDEAMRGRSDSWKAFMAMPFGNERLDAVFSRFKEAVAKTGFTLQRVDEQPKAGSIDNRIRVEVLTSRFVLAELTGDNNGVYWEAGFAEGLGKQVIYCCERGRQTHFDTNHLQTVFWDIQDLETAVEDLKAAIRATFPADAKMVD